MSQHTCSSSRLAIQTRLGRQGPITILSRLGWFSGSNPCSRCLLSTHLLWQASDKQRLLKEVFHKQILPAGPWLKWAFLSPSSGTQPIELHPSEACIEAGYGPALHPSGPGHPHTIPGHLCPPTPSVGTLLTQPCYLEQHGIKHSHQLGHNALQSSLFRSLKSLCGSNKQHCSVSKIQSLLKTGNGILFFWLKN